MLKGLLLSALFLSTASAQFEPPAYRAARTLDRITIDSS